MGGIQNAIQTVTNKPNCTTNKWHNTVKWGREELTWVNFENSVLTRYYKAKDKNKYK